MTANVVGGEVGREGGWFNSARGGLDNSRLSRRFRTLMMEGHAQAIVLQRLHRSEGGREKGGEDRTIGKPTLFAFKPW